MKLVVWKVDSLSVDVYMSWWIMPLLSSQIQDKTQTVLFSWFFIVKQVSNVGSQYSFMCLIGKESLFFYLLYPWISCNLLHFHFVLKYCIHEDLVIFYICHLRKIHDWDLVVRHYIVGQFLSCNNLQWSYWIIQENTAFDKEPLAQWKPGSCSVLQCYQLKEGEKN